MPITRETKSKGWRRKYRENLQDILRSSIKVDEILIAERFDFINGF